MRRGEVRILNELQHEQPRTIGELAEAIGKSQSWTSELVGSLTDQHLVQKNGQVSLADTYSAGLVVDLLRSYNLEKLIVGTREDILTVLVDGPKTVGELEQRGFSTSTIYEALNGMQEVGAVKETDGGYKVVDESVRQFIEARESTTHGTIYRSNGEAVIQTTADDPDGVPTAFSAFERYGLDYYPADRYLYRGDRELDIESVLIHAVRCADNQTQMAMCGVFYLYHRETVVPTDLWRLARDWECVEKWADLMAFLDQRDVRQADLFLPWAEFTALAQEYGVHPRGKHPEESVLDGLAELGETLDERVDAYLLGGANLILRDLKDTTKDIDVVLRSPEEVRVLVAGLQDVGYVERSELEAAYEQLAPHIVLEKEGFPQWDIFVDRVAHALQLTEKMGERSDTGGTYGNLHLHLLSLTDIFLFKAVSDREGDLEDAALIARQGGVDWQQVLAELQRQEADADQYFSFAVLDTLDLLVDQYGIDVPIRDRLASYCLEQALLMTLETPKTIKDLRQAVDFPDHQIYNKLRKLEDAELLDVDRSGTLNTYRLSRSER